MKDETKQEGGEARRRLEAAYASEKTLLVARLRAKGRSLEEAEDFVHDLYAEVVERISLVGRIVNLPAWINSLFARRLIDAWRHERVRAAAGESELAEEALREIIAGIGLDPLDEAVRSGLVDALALFGWAVMLLWNWIVPDAFGLKPLTYWKAWGLFLLCSILFKGMGSSSSGSGKRADRKRKEQLRSYMKDEAEGGAASGDPVS